LHFEVRFKGSAQNPARFVLASQASQQSARASR
jgi:murein DD-endopeptidase MepM/ murein hydrolase activator NlpD